MRLNFVRIAIVFGITIGLTDVFFEEYLFGLNTPIMLFALGIVIFAFYIQHRNEKKGK